MFVKWKCWIFKGNAVKTLVLVLARLRYNHPNEVIQSGKEPYEIGLQIYRGDQEQIVALRLPNMGLKVSSGSSRVCSVLGVVVVF